MRDLFLIINKKVVLPLLQNNKHIMGKVEDSHARKISHNQLLTVSSSSYTPRKIGRTFYLKVTDNLKK